MTMTIYGLSEFHKLYDNKVYLHFNANRHNLYGCKKSPMK